MNIINFERLQNKIHQQNKDMGWWDEPRPFSTFVCLFHSELSEAMEGDRKGLMDDHLPKYPMAAVELADYVIRLLDYLGSKNYEWKSGMSYPNRHDDSFIKQLAHCHQDVSEAFMKNIGESNEPFSPETILAFSVKRAEKLAVKMDWNLEQIINEKIEYNKHRSDHKRENRAKKNGKKY
ncbi:MAG: hypothetical protein ACTH6I_06945 [Vibrio litoralis]|uniref:hypothetical protein n=1 Tax=Vibrio litoralis TaxID=335972 RepID=UPI003F9DD1AF